jgi:hypothetical protein
MDSLSTSADKFRDFANVVYVYGPFALVLVFIFIAEWRLRPSLRNDSGPVRRVTIFTYAGAWIAALALAAICVLAWFKYNFHREYVINGTFEHIKNNETIYGDDSKLWLQRNYKVHQYNWHILSAAPIPADKPMQFTLSRQINNQVEDRIISLPIRAEFYNGQNVRMWYDSSSNWVYVVAGQRHDSIRPEIYSAANSPAKSFRDSASLNRLAGLFIALVPNAWAGNDSLPASLSPSELEDLGAADPIIRRNIRQKIGQAGTVGMQAMISALSDPQTPPQLIAKIIFSLSEIKFSGIPDSAKDVALKAKLLAEQARTPRKPAVISALARARMEALYTRGVEEKDLYRKRPADSLRIKKAFSLFEESFNLNKIALPGEEIFFGKALYGKALAWHDRSWLDRGPEKQRRPAYVKAAQDAFRHFLAFIKFVPAGAAYPYPDHLKKAEAYIRNPVPASLQ